jgi:hypothetical protein
LWSYYNEDNDSVIAANYFDEARLTVGDLVMVYAQGAVEASRLYRVSAKSTDKFTATVSPHAAQLNQAGASEIVTANSLYNVISTGNVVTLLVTAAANEASTFTTSATAGNYITLTEPIANGVHVILTTATTLPAGLEALTNYYAVDAGGDTFYGVSPNKCRLSLSRGGAAVAITGAGTGAHTATVQKNYFTLADGYEGQRKIIKVKTDGGIDAVILPENLKDGTIITAGDANDAMELLFADSEWQIIKNLGVAAS